MTLLPLAISTLYMLHVHVRQLTITTNTNRSDEWSRRKTFFPLWIHTVAVHLHAWMAKQKRSPATPNKQEDVLHLCLLVRYRIATISWSDGCVIRLVITSYVESAYILPMRGPQNESLIIRRTDPYVWCWPTCGRRIGVWRKLIHHTETVLRRMLGCACGYAVFDTHLRTCFTLTWI